MGEAHGNERIEVEMLVVVSNAVSYQLDFVIRIFVIIRKNVHDTAYSPWAPPVVSST